MIKNYNNFLNENTEQENYDSFKIKAYFNVDFYDFDYKYLIINTLHKMYDYSDIDKVILQYNELKNSDITLEILSYKFLDNNEIVYDFNVIYNKYRGTYDTMDKQETVIDGLEYIFDSTNTYRYRSEHEMDNPKVTNIEFLKMEII